MIIRSHAARSSLRVLVAIVAIAVVACGGKDKGSTSEALMKSDDSKVPKVDPTLCETEGKEVATFDLDRDKRPDVWKLYKQIEEGGARLDVLSCKQVDYDHDGEKDYVVAYDARGGKVFEKFDYDFDGRFDAFYQYNAKTGKPYEVQYESGFNGRYDLLAVYDEGGEVTSVKGDRNGDGEPDIWEQYVKGQLVAILYDDDYDSKVDRREEIEVQDDAPATPPPATDSEGAGGQEGGDGQEGDEEGDGDGDQPDSP